MRLPALLASLPSHPVLVQWKTNKSGPKGYSGAHNMGFQFPLLTLLTPGTNPEASTWSHSQEDQPATWWKVVYKGSFPLWKGQTLFSLEWTHQTQICLPCSQYFYHNQMQGFIDVLFTWCFTEHSSDQGSHSTWSVAWAMLMKFTHWSYDVPHHLEVTGLIKW